MATVVSNVDRYIGNKLKIKRVERGLSQSDMGKCVGLTFQQIQKYESGANRISSSKLYEFAKILNVPIVYFFEDLNIVPNIKNKKLDNNVVKLINYFGSIKNDNSRKIVLEFIKLILEAGL